MPSRRADLAQKLPHSLDHLSMGMTNDFEVAIEEGDPGTHRHGPVR